LRLTHQGLLVELAWLHEERDEYEPAIQALRQVVAAQPTHEEAHVGLMRLYALSGRCEEALKQHERLREALTRELGIEPDMSSRRLYEEISAGRFPPADPRPRVRTATEPLGDRRHNLPAPRTSFIGRKREMLEVRRLLVMTGLLTLKGAGGCGKTRLALEVARDLVGAYRMGGVAD